MTPTDLIKRARELVADHGLNCCEFQHECETLVPALTDALEAALKELEQLKEPQPKMYRESERDRLMRLRCGE